MCHFPLTPMSAFHPLSLIQKKLSIFSRQLLASRILNFYRSNCLNVYFKFEGIYNEDLIKSLKTVTSQAIGFDNISISMIRLVLPYCINEENHLFNQILKDGDFPISGKTANIRKSQCNNSGALAIIIFILVPQWNILIEV